MTGPDYPTPDNQPPRHEAPDWQKDLGDLAQEKRLEERRERELEDWIHA